MRGTTVGEAVFQTEITDVYINLLQTEAKK